MRFDGVKGLQRTTLDYIMVLQAGLEPAAPGLGISFSLIVNHITR